MKISVFGKVIIFFSKSGKIFRKFPIYLKINFQNLKNSQFFINFKISEIFSRNVIFQTYFFGWIFLDYFFSLRIFWGCSFDAEIGPLSIYEVFRAIPALLHLVWSKFQDLGSENGEGFVARLEWSYNTVFFDSFDKQSGLSTRNVVYCQKPLL